MVSTARADVGARSGTPAPIDVRQSGLKNIKPPRHVRFNPKNKQDPEF
jgi:hypothetical protein